MADLAVPVTYLENIKEPVSVQRKWLQVQIQERKSRINATRQTIEDLQKGQIVKLEGTMEMLTLELNELESRLANLK